MYFKGYPKLLTRNKKLCFKVKYLHKVLLILNLHNKLLWRKHTFLIRVFGSKLENINTFKTSYTSKNGFLEN